MSPNNIISLVRSITTRVCGTGCKALRRVCEEQHSRSDGSGERIRSGNMGWLTTGVHVTLPFRPDLWTR